MSENNKTKVRILRKKPWKNRIEGEREREVGKK
jgi:hypothetical protein